jgi:hypothetical protein
VGLDPACQSNLTTVARCSTTGYLLCDCTRYIGAREHACWRRRQWLSADLRLVIRSSAYQASQAEAERGAESMTGLAGSRHQYTTRSWRVKTG